MPNDCPSAPAVPDEPPGNSPDKMSMAKSARPLSALNEPLAAPLMTRVSAAAMMRSDVYSSSAAPLLIISLRMLPCDSIWASPTAVDPSMRSRMLFCVFVSSGAMDSALFSAPCSAAPSRTAASSRRLLTASVVLPGTRLCAGGSMRNVVTAPYGVLTSTKIWIVLFSAGPTGRVGTLSWMTPCGEVLSGTLTVVPLCRVS
mmetsp:Transcript_2610/g.6744  ORF Transcript_2610/g.6744 Transcript_2610/m.6744 type:complete len:201 (-) Transcript_2610:3547-4149(-)